jgi:uncharacterized protein (TIGR00730 family)
MPATKTKSLKKPATIVKGEEFSKMAHEPVDFKRPWRIFKIMAEFVEGYDFINDLQRTVAILGSARTKPSNKYYKEAVKLGKLLGKGGYTTLTGAGPGIMEAANKGAYEAKGESVGINIELPFEQIINPYVKKAQGFDYFFTRKVMLLSPAQAFVFFPGGYGTMDEFFEVFDLMEIGQLQDAPLIVVGSEYWQPVLDFLKNQALGHEILDQEMFNRVFLVETAEEAYDIISSTKEISSALCPLSPDQFACEKEINWRVFKIMAELVEGFDTVTRFTDDVTVLGSKSLDEETEYYHQAYRLGLALGRKKYTVVTGGGPGITEAANKGAYQVGATSLGLIMKYDHQDMGNPYLNSHSLFQYPFTRKLILTAPSHAFVVFPGGLGTMHQTFELLTLMQTEKARKIPVIFFDSAYWKPMLDFIENILLKKFKTISPGDEKYYTVVDDIDEAMKIIEKQPRESEGKKKKK